MTDLTRLRSSSSTARSTRSSWLPRHAGPTGRQARHRPVLPRPRARARDRGVRLPPRRRRRHEPAARLPVHQLGHRLRRPGRRSPTSPRRACCRGSRARHGGLRPGRPGRRTRSRCRRGASCSRQIERAHELGPRRSGAPPSSSSSCSRRPSKRPATSGGAACIPHFDSIEDYQLLQTSREEYVLRRVRNEMVRGRHPHRVLQGRGRPRPARGQRHLRRARSRRPTATSSSRTG